MKKISISLFEIWISWSFGYHYLDNLITNNLYTYKYRKLWIIENEHTISKQKQQERRPTEIGESLLESKHDLDLFFFSPTILLLPFFFFDHHGRKIAGHYHASWPIDLSLSRPPRPPQMLALPATSCVLTFLPPPSPFFVFEISNRTHTAPIVDIFYSAHTFTSSLLFFFFFLFLKINLDEDS